MKNLQIQKPITATLFFLTFIFHSSAQHFKNAPFESIGEYDAKTLYVRAFDFIHSNALNVYSIENNEFLKKMTIVTPEDYILQVFIYNDNFFLFTSDIKTEAYSLVKLDDHFREESRVKLMDKREEGLSIKARYDGREKPFLYDYFQKDHRIAVSIKHIQNRFIIADLENMTFNTHTSTLKKDTEYSIEDCLLGDELDAVFIVATQSSIGSAFVICQEANHRNILVPYQNKKTKNYVFNFKFVRDPATQTDYVASMYFNESKKEQGYTLASIPDFHFDSIPFKIIPDGTLNNPAIWTKNQYKKVQQNKIPVRLPFYDIVSAEFINGFLIVQSQLSSPIGAGNILVSRIDPDNDSPKVKWTFLSHFSTDSYIRYNTKMGHHNFISLIRDNELWIYHNILTGHLTPEGIPNRDHKEVFPENSPGQKSRIIKTTINMESGEFSSKTPENSDSSKGKLTNPCYHIEDGILTCFLYEINFLTKQFSDPVIVSIPLD